MVLLGWWVWWWTDRILCVVRVLALLKCLSGHPSRIAVQWWRVWGRMWSKRNAVTAWQCCGRAWVGWRVRRRGDGKRRKGGGAVHCVGVLLGASIASIWRARGVWLVGTISRAWWGRETRNRRRTTVTRYTWHGLNEHNARYEKGRLRKKWLLLTNGSF